MGSSGSGHTPSYPRLNAASAAADHPRVRDLRQAPQPKRAIVVRVHLEPRPSGERRAAFDDEKVFNPAPGERVRAEHRLGKGPRGGAGALQERVPVTEAGRGRRRLDVAPRHEGQVIAAGAPHSDGMVSG